MKILIPLTILVLSFIIYYFFSVPQKVISKESVPLNTKELSSIEPTIKSESNYIPSLATIQIKPEKSTHTSQTNISLEELRVQDHTQNVSSQVPKEYLTLEDLRNKVHGEKPNTISSKPIRETVSISPKELVLNKEKKLPNHKLNATISRPLQETVIISPNRVALAKALDDLREELDKKKSLNTIAKPIRRTIPTTPRELVMKKAEEDLKKELHKEKPSVATSLPIRETLPMAPEKLVISKAQVVEKKISKVEPKKELPIIKKEMLTKKPTVVSKKYDQEILTRLKKRLQQSASEYSAKEGITLSSSISSILSAQDDEIIFRAFLYADFGLENETIDKQLKQNHTVLDWAMFLSR